MSKPNYMKALNLMKIICIQIEVLIVELRLYKTLMLSKHDYERIIYCFTRHPHCKSPDLIHNQIKSLDNNLLWIPHIRKTICQGLVTEAKIYHCNMRYHLTSVWNRLWKIQAYIKIKLIQIPFRIHLGGYYKHRKVTCN